MKRRDMVLLLQCPFSLEETMQRPSLLAAVLFLSAAIGAPDFAKAIEGNSTAEAFAALDSFGANADGLKAVARYLVERKN